MLPSWVGHGLYKCNRVSTHLTPGCGVTRCEKHAVLHTVNNTNGSSGKRLDTLGITITMTNNCDITEQR